jgi:hypothetical protein
VSKLEKLKAKRWKLAEAMDSAQSVAEMSVVMMQLQEVVMKIYYLESEAEGLTKKQAKKKMQNIMNQHGIPMLSKGNQK